MQQTHPAVLQAFFDRAPVGLGLWDCDLRCVRVNPALAEIIGVPADQHPGRRPSELLGELGQRVEGAFRDVLATGAALDLELSGRTPATVGADRHWLVSFYPLHEEDGSTGGVGAVVIDITERRRAEAESDRLRSRAEFLARSAETLASSLDSDATVRAVVEAAVPDLADWCACTLLEGDELRLLALAHADPADAPDATAIRARWPQRVDADTPVPAALRLGRSMVFDIVESNEHHRVLYALGARTGIVVPLTTPTGVLGAIALLHARSGRRHGPDDLEIAQLLADRAAVAIAHARSHEAAQRRLALLDALFDSAPVGIAYLDEELRYQRVNGKLAELNGVPAEAHIGRTVTDVLGSSGEPLMDLLRRVLDGETTIGEVQTPGPRHFLTSYAPVRLGDERIGVTGVVLEITGRKRAEARERLIGTVNQALDAQSTVHEAAQRLCDLLVPALGDACIVALRDDDGWEHIVEAGDERAAGAEFLAPLTTRGRTIGTVTLIAGVDRELCEEDRRTVEDVARRAALSLDNLVLYAGQKEIASTLQGRLLPRRIPCIEGVEVATRYRAAGEHNEVGGDFYDVFPGPDGLWTALVGDVAGKGAEAAALTASIRQIVRTGSRWSDDARELLAVVNDELLGDAESRTCTLAHAALHDEGERMRVAVTLAGHPLPLILRADGSVETAGRPGTLLGALPDLDLVTDEAVLWPGDLMLLFTDGAIEVGRDGRRGELLDLGGVLAGCAGGDAAEVVRCVEEAAVEAAGGRPQDDIALVCLKRR